MAEDLFGIGKATEAVAKEVASLIGPLFRPGAEVTGQMIADQMGHWRLTRIVLLGKKQQKLLEDNNIQPRMVPPKLLLPILMNGSLEDDDDMLDKWAGLLASAAAGDPVHTIYPKILSELTSTDAKILDAIYQRLIETTSEEHDLFTLGELSQQIDVPPEEFQIAIHNLNRLELWEVPASKTGRPVTYVDLSGNIPKHLKVRLLPIGRGFVKTCRGPLSR
jgi:hypothetical protein